MNEDLVIERRPTQHEQWRACVTGELASIYAILHYGSGRIGSNASSVIYKRMHEIWRQLGCENP